MTKVTQPKKKEGDFSLFSNLNPNVDKNTQTVSKKKLIRGLLHGIGYRVSIGNPITTLSDNINLHIKQMQKQGVNSEVVALVKHQSKFTPISKEEVENTRRKAYNYAF